MRAKHAQTGAIVQESSDGTLETGKPGPSGSPENAAGLDEFDTAILRYLERHGRATNYEVGEAVGLSASATSRRILALESSATARSLTSGCWANR
jgi:uncharacterized membrane protein